MKKSILAIILLFTVAQSNCGVFDDAMSFLKKTATSLFEKGKKVVSDNSDKILSKVKTQATALYAKGKEQAGQLYEKGVGMAKEKATELYGTAKEKAGEMYEKGMTMAKEQAGQLYETGMGMAKEKATSLYEQGKTKLYGTLGLKQPEMETMAESEIEEMPVGGAEAGITIDQAATELISVTNAEADKETKELTVQAQNLVTKTTGLTPSEQKIILQEAQNLANQNRAALIQQANESIAKKREALKQSIYAKFGKGTPTTK